jgi:hypothetical protein
VVFTVLANGSGGSVLLAMLFHAALNAAPAVVLPAYSGADLERFLSLFGMVTIAAGIVAALVTGPRLAQRRILQAPLVPAPVTA